MPIFRPLAALVTLALAALAFVSPAQAQTGQSLYILHCQGCHGSPSQNNDGVLGGKDWNIIKLAMDTRPDMTAVLRPLYNAGLLTDEDFQKIATYLQGFSGGAVSRLAMPAAIDFGSVAVGVASSVVSRNVTAAADANAASQISTVSSSNPLEFVITTNTCNGAFIFPGSPPCTIGVQFTPAASGARSGQIIVSSNGIGSPQNFAVSGTGGSAPPPPPPPPPPTGSLTVPSTYNFGSQNVGVQGLAQAITITNNSGASVTVSNVSVGPSSDFSLSTNLCGTVPNGGSCQILAAFRPSQVGTRNGTVSITSNGSGSPQSIALSGTGVGTTPPPPPPPPPPTSTVTVVEYFHAGMGHYFVTGYPSEIAVLDGNPSLGWARTGQTFKGYASATAGAVTVERFFTASPLFNGKSSHFYTGYLVEYNNLQAGGVWGYEGPGFYLQLPGAGGCGAGLVSVYRAYNNAQGGAPNHRFTTQLSIYTDFVNNRGYAGEGVVFCAPQ